MKKLKKAVSIMICILLMLAAVNIAYAQNAGGQAAVSLQSDGLRLQLSPGKTLAGEKAAGNISSIAQIKESAAAPVTVIAAPADNAHIYNTYTVTGTATAAKMSHWALYYGIGSSPTSWTLINSGADSVMNGTLGTWYIGTFKDGATYTLKLTATDLAGNTSKTTSTITIDSSVAPFTDMAIPNNTSNINGTVTVLGTISDPSLSGWKLDYGAGNSPTNWTVLTTGTNPMSNEVAYQWDTGSLKNGELYTVRISCTDQSGNYSQTTKHLKKDNTIPTASISSPENNAHISGTCTVTGSVSGTKLTYWELDYGAGRDPSSWTDINTGNTPVTDGTLGTWNTGSLKTGSIYTLQLTVADSAGNRIMSVSQFTIDPASNSTAASNPAPAPVTTITSPANNSTVKGNETVTGTVSDTNMGRWTLEFGSGISPAKWTEISSGLTSVTNGTLGSWDTSSLPAGIYTLKLTQVDIGGNTQQTNVQVTAGPPTTDSGVRAPSINPDVSGAAAATGTAADANTSSWFSEFVNDIAHGVESLFQQAYTWITGK